MTLNVELPEPPSLSGSQSRGDYDAIDMTDEEIGDDYRREEIEVILEDGAWQDAFEDWQEETYMSEEEFEKVVELGLIDEFDIYWKPATDQTGYRAPSLSTPSVVPSQKHSKTTTSCATKTSSASSTRSTQGVSKVRRMSR
ncbi:MAG: hypothetical protein SXQ77_03725 [Halobacteria archaeon]|nr:hypothetical protein [Halobacteria archaeon]